MLPANGVEGLSTGRRPMDVEDYLDVLRRHRSWILGPAFACLVIGTVGAFLWPDTYISSAVVRVIPPQVPERYIPTNVNADITQRINSIYQSVTSRNTLTNIINLYKLYPRDRQRLPMEDVIEQMRKDVNVRFVGQMNAGAAGRNQVQAFEISFAYENRLLAQKIVSELVTRFIDENIRTRASQSLMTTDFLRDQWEQRKRELEAVEARLTKFRQENQGRLPEERMGLQSALNMLETRMANLNGQLSRATQDKLLLESRLAVLKDQVKQLSAPEPVVQAAVAKNQRLLELERSIQAAETQLEAARQRYKDTHPDIRILQNNLAVLRRTRDALQREEEQKPESPASESPAPPRPAVASRELRAYEVELAATQSAIEAKNLEIDNFQKEIQATERNIRSYQARLEAMPASVSEYEDLLREKRLASEKYEEMTQKMAQSQSATELENRKQGETLELLDPANLPTSPAKPKRPLIIGASAGIGLALGLFLALARELKDTTLKNLKDVRAYTQLMVLGSIPLLENDLVVRRRRRLAVLAWTTAGLTGIATMAGSVLYYYSNRT